MGLRLFCLCLLVICFIVAALGISHGRFNLIGVGLALLSVLAVMLGLAASFLPRVTANPTDARKGNLED